ncbi:MAG: response regulator, partial [bacterium]
MESEKSKYKVLIIDDSVVVRKSLKDIIDDSEDFMVIGTAQDPYEARQILRSIKPDVVTLDIEMPRMNGLAFLDK